MPVIPSLSLTIQPATALYKSIVPEGNMTASTSTAQGRTEIVIDFNGGNGLYSRDLGTIFSWPVSAGTILDVWQPSFIELPESTYNRSGDWMDGGYAGAKFVQGYEVECDSFGAFKTFSLQSADDDSINTLNEMPAQFTEQNVKFFSCQPFIAHNVRRVSSDGISCQVFRENLVFQPYPESCLQWTTELVSFGMGWQHLRMLNIPYIASDPVTLTLTFDQWSTIVVTDQLPATPSQLTPFKQLVTIPANKSKLVGFSLTSSAPFRVFAKMLEVWVGAWGRTSAYEKVMPFGGPSNEGALV